MATFFIGSPILILGLDVSALEPFHLNLSFFGSKLANIIPNNQEFV
jgi:hypothetical protein